MPVKPTPVLDRILARVEKRGDCWVFTGALNTGGYGIVQLGRGIGTDRTHRVVYREMIGPIPEGLTLDHLCATPACCNPDHLEPVSRAENARRQHAAGRGASGEYNRTKTHCLRGHPFDEANTYVTARGHRACRTCGRERMRERRRRQ